MFLIIFSLILAESSHQIVGFAAVLLSFLLLQICVWPWRGFWQNCLDVFQQACVLGMAVSVAPLATLRAEWYQSVEEGVREQVGR